MAKRPEPLAEAVARLTRAIERRELRHDREKHRANEDALSRRLELDRSGDAEMQAALNGERPRQFNVVTLMRAAPGLYDQFTYVPYKRRFFQVRGNEALVRCPCGGHPRVGAGHAQRCPGGCGRLYFFAGRGRLLVARFEDDEEAEAPNSDQ